MPSMRTARLTVVMRSPSPRSALRHRPRMRGERAGSLSMILTTSAMRTSSMVPMERRRAATGDSVGRVWTRSRISSTWRARAGSTVGEPEAVGAVLMVQRELCVLGGSVGGGAGLGLELQELGQAGHQVGDLERLLEEPVGPGVHELLDVGLVDDAADAQDLGVGEIGIAAEALADHRAVDVRQHEVEDDQVRAEGLGEQARVVPGAGGLHVEPAVAAEQVAVELHDLGIVVDHQDALL